MKKLDRFILRDTLSDGPGGTVYRADEILPGDNRRTVALRVLPIVPAGAVAGETAEEQRFFAEVRILSRLAVQPHLVTFYAMGLTDGYPWLAMEYAAATLAQRLSDAPAEPQEVVRLLNHAARGLAGLHAFKPPLIHQDLQPQNILVDAAGNYKITDFSLGSITAAGKTHTLATVRYAAPELLSNDSGAVGPPTDLYALGHIAYEFALGSRLHRPQFPAVFEGSTGKEPPPNKWMMWHASMNTEPAAVAEVIKGFPQALSDIIARLMRKSLAERYASAGDLLGDLSAQETGAGSAMPRPPSALKSPSTPAAPANETAPARAGNTAAGHDPTARFWLRLRGKVTGPFDLAALQKQVKHGQISRLHQISPDQNTWKQASELEGLFGPTVV